MPKKIFLAIMVFIFFSLPLIVQAENVYHQCYLTGNCGFCEALEIGIKISKVIMGLAGSLALLFFVMAGFVLILSQGNPEKIRLGKKMMLSTIIGIFIVYLAWVGVNFIIYSFTNAQETGKNIATIFGRPWNSFECVRSKLAAITPGEEAVVPVGGACKSLWENGSEPACNTLCGGTSGKSCSNTCLGFTLSDIDYRQCADASPALIDFLNQIKNKLSQQPNKYFGLTLNDIIITSISDDHGLKTCRDENNSACFHRSGGKNNSCHYGLGQTDGSYAIDIRSYVLAPLPNKKLNITNVQLPPNSKAAGLKQLIIDAGGNFWDERYDHVTYDSLSNAHFHASVGACGGI